MAKKLPGFKDYKVYLYLFLNLKLHISRLEQIEPYLGILHIVKVNHFSIKSNYYIV